MGKEEDEWLEDDDNLAKWENNELTASNRRILLATWYVKAVKAALSGRRAASANTLSPRTRSLAVHTLLP